MVAAAAAPSGTVGGPSSPAAPAATRSAWWEEQARAAEAMKREVNQHRSTAKASARGWYARQTVGLAAEATSAATANRSFSPPRTRWSAPQPEPEPEQLQPAVGRWGARHKSSEWKLTQKGLEAEALSNEVNVVWWGGGGGALGVVWRGMKRGGTEDDEGFEIEPQELSPCVHRTYLPGGSDPRAPYEQTAAWLRMVGMQAADDEAREQGRHPHFSGPAVFHSAAASGFRASFEPTVGAAARTSPAAAPRSGADDGSAARDQLVPGLMLYRLHGKLLDPTATFNLADALKPLRQHRDSSAAQRVLGTADGAMLHTTFLHDNGRYYQACFFERALPRFRMAQPRVRSEVYGSVARSFGVQLALAPAEIAAAKAALERRLSMRFGAGSADVNGADTTTRGKPCGGGGVRPRLAHAAEKGMIIAAISAGGISDSTAEWPRQQVRARLRELYDSPVRPVKITFIAKRPSSGWGGVHDRYRGPTPGNPQPASSTEAWEQMLAAGRHESAARQQAVVYLVVAGRRGPAVFMGSLGMDETKGRLGLAACYKAKYGYDRPAADSTVNWDRYED